MQIGNVWLRIDGFGSSIPLTDVSPAEVAILNENHEVNAKTDAACFDLTNVHEEKRDNQAEIGRLREKYINAKNKKGESLAVTLYPGKNPVLPQKFEEVGLATAGKVPLETPKTTEPQKDPAAKPPDHPTSPQPTIVK